MPSKSSTKKKTAASKKRGRRDPSTCLVVHESIASATSQQITDVVEGRIEEELGESLSKIALVLEGGSVGADVTRGDGDIEDADEGAVTWSRLDDTHAQLTSANKRHAEIWEQLDVLIPRRDHWLQQFEEADAAGRSALENAESTTAFRASKATQAGRQASALAKSHTVRRRRLCELNDQVMRLCREVHDLETKFAITNQRRLDAMMRAAIENDSPATMLAALSHTKKLQDEGKHGRIAAVDADFSKAALL